MAFLWDVSPFLFLTCTDKSLKFESIFLCFCNLLLIYGTYCTCLRLCTPFSWFLIKFRTCLGFQSMSTMALWYDIVKLLPLEFLLGLWYLQHFLVRNIMTDMLYYGLALPTHKECPVPNVAMLIISLFSHHTMRI